MASIVRSGEARATGLGRSPHLEMSAEDVVDLVGYVEARGIRVWLDGGWAVDAALGAQTRAHDDLDLVVGLGDVEALLAALGERGYTVAHGAAPKSFELLDERGRQVDVHPVVSSAAGDGVYLMEDGEEWIYPATGFSGRGSVLGRRLRCLSPEVQLLCHTGYEPHRTSFEDVWMLSRGFGLLVPDEYRGRPESYPLRA